MRHGDLQLALQDGEEGELHGDTEQGGDDGDGEEEEAKGLKDRLRPGSVLARPNSLSEELYFLNSNGAFKAVIFPSIANEFDALGEK